MEPREYQRVRELYHQLADRPWEECRRVLDGLELSDEMRGELEALLDPAQAVEPFDEEREGGLAMRIAGSNGESAPAEALSAVPLPRTIAGYRIVELLGQGGMGVVYRGVQERPRREVAVKVLQAVPAGSDVLRRFEYEAEVLARLDHPYVAKVIEAGVDPVLGGVPYLVMELVEGEDLIVHCERSGLGLRGRLELFSRVCAGVEHAHQNGIVHRDLKPANVLVSPDGRPRILDFGIARPAGAEDRSTPGRTRTGSVRGSLAWMSPEQARGELSTLDVRSDVYSLGVVFYRLLAGAMPYDLSGLPPWIAARRICEAEPPRLGKVRPELRGDLEAIAAMALEKEPAQRYPGAGALGRDVQRFLEDQPVEARPWSTSYQLAKFARRHGLFVATAGVLLAAVVAGLLGSLFLWRQAEAARDLADGEARRARESEAEAERGSAYLLRLADLQRVRDLAAEADGYWPVGPELVPLLEDWLRRAETLAGNLVHHEAFRSEIEAGDSTVTAGLDAAQRAWWLGALDVLLEEMGAFAGEGGTIEGVHRRLARSRTLRARSIEDRAEAWERAIAHAADPEGPYGGLALRPQLGLVPYPPNPATGLLDFWHVESGERPEQDPATGAIEMWDTSGIVLVLVPGGTFLMGSQKADPAGPNYDPHANYPSFPPHAVTLSPFFISRFEMSQGQWERIAGENPAYFQAAHSRDREWPRAHPVDRVAWDQCVEILHRVGLRLPTEAQWEYAARAGTDSSWWCGTEPDCLQATANLGDEFARQDGAPDSWYVSPWNDGYATAAPLGAFPGNAFGLHEVHGNVREWVLDAYSERPYGRGPVDDPHVSETDRDFEARTVRGADVGSSPGDACVAVRSIAPAEGYSATVVGLRPARALDSTGL